MKDKNLCGILLHVRKFAKYLEIAADTLFFVFFVQAFVVQAFVVPTSSMEDTLLIGDHLLVNKLYYAPYSSKIEKFILPIGDVKRGDIVVFRFPKDPRFDYVKRVIGLPGDVVEVLEGHAYVNGKLIDGPYVRFKPTPYKPPDFGPIKVPEGHLFVMGDNRNNSYDSRFWGFLPMNHLRGRPWFIYWSLRKSTKEYSFPTIFHWMWGMVKSIVETPFRTRWKRILTIPH